MRTNVVVPKLEFISDENVGSDADGEDDSDDVDDDNDWSTSDSWLQQTNQMNKQARKVPVMHVDNSLPFQATFS